MKKVLTVIEIDYHSEVLRTLLLISIHAKFQVRVITTKIIWEKTGLSPEQVTLLLVDDFKSVKDLFQLNVSKINNSYCIIFNTSSSYYKFFAKQRFIPPVLVRIHNVNTSFIHPLKNYKLKFTPYFLWKDLSHFFRRELISNDYKWRKRFYNSVDGFSFFGRQMEEYAKSLKGIDNNKIMSPGLPSAFYEGRDTVEPAKRPLTFTIIGGIDVRRRDYDLLIKAIKLLKGDYALKKSIRIVLLGRPNGAYGKRVQQELKGIEGTTIFIEMYNEFVSQDEFDKVLSVTDYLVNPLKEVTRHTIYTEYYGETKISGAVNDMIQHGLRAVFPEFYNPIEGLEKEHFSYVNTPEGLAKTLLEIVHQHSSFSDKTQNYSKLFSLDAMAEQMIRTLDGFS